MHTIGLLFLSLLVGLSKAQSYTSCHRHDAVEYCYGPDGDETAVQTYTDEPTAASVSQSNPASISAITTPAAQITAVSECHLDGTTIMCHAENSQEVIVSVTGTPTGEPPAQYTDCHAHDEENFCVDPNGDDVLVVPQAAQEGGDSHEEDEHSSGTSEGQTCHFHAGVEHCTGPGESENSSTASCELGVRDYNVPLRIGCLFVILVTSGIGVFGPIMLDVFSRKKKINVIFFAIVKQFGTGVIIATALIHLLTHAELLFKNECIGTLSYEATPAAIAMAGLFLSFAVEYISQRIVKRRFPSYPNDQTEVSSAEGNGKGLHSPAPKALDIHQAGLWNTKISVLVTEAGIIFHSILLGLTLVVAGDSFYLTLFTVILFHQFFEGLALGSRIACLPPKTTKLFPTKFLMALAYALITPLGMAIGLGVLNTFNGNDPATVIAIATLDALSAGILLYAGIVGMLARDWIVPGGELVEANMLQTAVGAVALVAGMVLMGLLGKWA